MTVEGTRVRPSWQAYAWAALASAAPVVALPLVWRSTASAWLAAALLAVPLAGGVISYMTTASLTVVPGALVYRRWGLVRTVRLGPRTKGFLVQVEEFEPVLRLAVRDERGRTVRVTGRYWSTPDLCVVARRAGVLTAPHLLVSPRAAEHIAPGALSALQRRPRTTILVGAVTLLASCFGVAAAVVLALTESPS